ncbi:MAG: homocysteine S-methyltransferase family protein [Clostridiales Family XIII bacterium]|nr:homocysteine S-methyltransferase family protein [Clostridiales Family XIII bacterium]
MSITELFGQKILIGDGAMGTMIQAAGTHPGELPEILNLTKPDLIKNIHKQYFMAGSDYVCTNTFGANRLKLAPRGVSMEEMARAAVKNARAAALETGNAEKRVALDVGPTGKLMEPMGDMGFDEAYGIFKDIALAGEAAGADFAILETFTDIYEMKAALLAFKENVKTPIVCSVTFQEDGRMLTGTDPMTAVCILQDMGVAAVGLNCSLGPEMTAPIVAEMLRHAHVPVIAQPNAGIPAEIDGRAAFGVGAEAFAAAMRPMIEAGVSIVGGCCGTSPEYIRALRDMLDGMGRQVRPQVGRTACFPTVCSPVRTVALDGRTRIIGERLNPTGKKMLKQALIDGDYDFVEDEALAQARAGAELLEVNMGLPDIDEGAMLVGCVRRLEKTLDAPLVIDCADGDKIEAAMRASRGKPLINSVNGEARKMKEIFPIVKKYGASVIALTLDENGIPDSVEARLAILDKIVAEAESYGIGKERLVVDCLTLTASARQDACIQTLEAVKLVRDKYGMRTALGVSNISFGLPERGALNRSFLTMALMAGLDAPIIDPLNPAYVEAVRAAEVLLGKDRDAKAYIEYEASAGRGDGVRDGGPGRNGVAGAGTAFGGLPPKNGVTVIVKEPYHEKSLEEIIRGGFESRAAAAAEKLLLTAKPLEIIEQVVMPALEAVGADFENGEVFLPQMIKSADAAKGAFEVLRAALRARGESVSYGRVILATVKDDIHDIGKNIVKAIMENYGYDIIDLGKDVPPETIVKTAQEEKIRLVGLSALMTTTVANMAKTIDLIKETGLDCVTAVGGAVLTPAYARKIGADRYCANAMDAVHMANGIFRTSPR